MSAKRTEIGMDKRRERERIRYAENKVQWSQRIRARRDKQKAAIDAIKVDTGCMDCGYNSHCEALEFDHRPGVLKLFSIANHAGLKWEKIAAEIAKCDVVCANCHRVRTADRR